ncbi:MAG: MerR family transcriptional regulator [Tidjanibacter sp.]|nr:MerR family transcriptional regulator [Tidjanibacter sp.]
MKDIVHAKGKLYYSMGEVCEIFGVKPSLIRHWENEFRILRPSRNSKGNRMYTPKDVDNIKLIYHLVKEKGMTLAGADKRLRQNPDGIMREAEVVEHLQHIRSMLVELRTQLGGEENVVAEFDEADDYAIEETITAQREIDTMIEELVAESLAEEDIEEEVAEEEEIEEVAEPIAEEAAPAEEEADKKPKFVEVAMFPEEEIAPKTEVKKEEKKSERRIVEQTLF